MHMILKQKKQVSTFSGITMTVFPSGVLSMHIEQNNKLFIYLDDLSFDKVFLFIKIE